MEIENNRRSSCAWHTVFILRNICVKTTVVISIETRIALSGTLLSSIKLINCVVSLRSFEVGFLCFSDRPKNVV